MATDFILAQQDAKRRYHPANGAPKASWKGPWPTLAASFDADDLTAANATTLTRWPERTGKGLDLIQTTGANQPTCEVDGTSGRRNVYCATSQYLLASGFANSGWGQPASYAQPLTICAVLKASSGSSAFRALIAGQTQAGSVALGLEATNQFATILAGSTGSRGGPSLNDDAWHTVVIVFGTTHGFVMVDGCVVSAAVTQSHGANTLVKLAVGAYADGTNGCRGCRYRRVDVFAGALSVQQASMWSTQMMANWGLGSPPPQTNVTWVDVTDAGGQSVRIFRGQAVGASAPVAIVNHQQAGTTNVDQSYWLYPVIHALAARGFVVTYSNNHGADSWSNDNAENDVANARTYVNTNIATVTGSLLVGASMGAALAVIAAKDNKLSDLRGVYLIDPAVNLQWMYANGYSASLNTAFTITQAADIPAGKDPNTLTGAQLPQGMRWRAVASSADATVSKANNIDLFATIIGAATPAEYALVTHVDGHAARGSSIPSDIDAFVKRCGFTGLAADLAAA